MGNAMKTLEKQQRIMEKKGEERELLRKKKEGVGVFGFLNKRLSSEGSKSGGAGWKKTKDSNTNRIKQSSSADLKKRSDQEVNVQIFRTSEEVRSVERDLVRLRQQLARNLDRDRKVAENVKQKIAQQEKYLAQLQTSSRILD